MMESNQLICQRNEETGLVRAAADGDRSAFDLLVRQHSDRIFRLALGMLGHRDDAADVQQEAFVQAYRKLRSFRGESSFATWMYAITTRLCLMRRRSRARRPETVSEDALLERCASPENVALEAESSERIRQTLGRMAANDRLLIVLRYIEQLDHREIAAVLGCSEASSRSRLSRARKLFRHLYGGTE